MAGLDPVGGRRRSEGTTHTDHQCSNTGDSYSTGGGNTQSRELCMWFPQRIYIYILTLPQSAFHILVPYIFYQHQFKN